MSCYNARVNVIEKTLKENILDKNSVFIFNSDIAANSWTDFIVRKDGQDGWPQSVALERFLAWDDFKGQTLKIQEEGLEAIPSLLRKLFARDLLQKIKDGANLFERLVNSDYRENALSFTDWISSILPSLGRWKDLISPFVKGGKLAGERDTPENRDYLLLYNEYSKFLAEKKLFEPSWQKAVFEPCDAKTYFLFFPELLDDFDEYKEVLEEAEKSGKVRLTRIPESDKEIKADYWTSARLELRMTALRILKEKEAGTDWNDMALCVPDIENYRPYVERELGLYQIPFVTRSGVKLGLTGAGRIFRKIQDCVSNSFSYQSVRALLLDSNFPWKNPDELETLVRLGKESKCLVQFKDKDGKVIDPWLVDLNEIAPKSQNAKEYLRVRDFYANLKAALQKISKADSFAKIKKEWKNFEGAFIKPQNEIQESANLILSRCVALLDQLIALEEKFPELIKGKADNYSFFLNEIESVQYQKQSKERGVSIYDYRVSAMAAVKKQFVINASQDKITVEKIPLPFLSPKERALLLGDKKDDHSQAYVRSYDINSDCAFSCSQNALDGFAIPHSALTSEQDPAGALLELDQIDFIKIEKDFLANKEKAPQALTALQKASFEKYLQTNGDTESLDSIKSNQEKKGFLSAAIERKTNGELRLTPSELKDFFPCPRKWIFKDLLQVNEFSLDTELFEIYDQGNINHKILETYFKGLKEKGGVIPTLSEESQKLVLDGDEDYEKNELLPLLEKYAGDAYEASRSYRNSALVKETLRSQNRLFANAVMQFLKNFCKKDAFGGWKIEEVEWGQGHDAPLPPTLRGRMDLVLRSPENEIAIIDYKNSSSSIPGGNLNLKDASPNPDGSPAELDDYQIAAYVYLWENSNPAQKDRAQKASFVSIKKYCETQVIGDGKKAVAREDFDPAIQSLKRQAKVMSDSLQSASFKLDKVKRHQHCASCDYKNLCRTTF